MTALARIESLRPGYAAHGRPIGPVATHLSLAVALFAVVLSCGCSRGEDNSDADIVARVGPDIVTAEEFRLSYSLAFPHTTRGNGGPREAYLSRMIDERVLALEAYRLGLDRSDKVQRRIESLRAELLVEQVFGREVNDRVTLSEGQILQALANEQVRFKLRY